MGGFLSSLLGRKPAETPIKGIYPRIKNIAINNFRGILGVLIPIIILSWQIKLQDKVKTAMHIWIWMACFFFIQPVSIQVTGSIPIFAFPMLGVQETTKVVKAYFNEGIALFIVGGMVHLLLNNSGFDKRLGLFILCKGKPSTFSPFMLLLKTSAAGFILSMISHRLIIANTLIQYMTPVLMDLSGATSKSKSEPNFQQIRYIINNGIQTSCSIGGIGIVHASYCTLAFRSIFNGCVANNKEYADIFNYLQYTSFAIPVAIALFIINFICHLIMLKIFGGKSVSDARLAEIKTSLSKNKSSIPKRITNHEKWTLFFAVFSFCMFLGRWNEWTQAGWAKFSIGDGESIPKVKDATCAAMFVILLHVLPRSFGFIKIFTARKKSQLPPVKAESAILFWRFIDKNTNYAYFFVIARLRNVPDLVAVKAHYHTATENNKRSGIALYQAAQIEVPISEEEKNSTAMYLMKKFKFLTDLEFNIGLLVICLVTVAMCNLISGVATVAIWLPLILCLRSNDPENTGAWVKSIHRAALGVGIGSSFGFISPFLYTPAYFCHHVGKVPKLAMLKYSVVPCILMAILLWVALAYFAPIIFGQTINVYNTPSTLPPYGETTTLAVPGGGAETIL